MLFVTSRILVVDLLKSQCPADKVTGVLVFNAHRYNCKLYAMKVLVGLRFYFMVPCISE